MLRLIHIFWPHLGGDRFPVGRRKRYIISVGTSQMRLKEFATLEIQAFTEPIRYMSIRQQLVLRNSDSSRTNWEQLVGTLVDGCLLLKSSVPQRWVVRLTPYGKNLVPALRQMMQGRQYLTRLEGSNKEITKKVGGA